MDAAAAGHGIGRDLRAAAAHEAQRRGPRRLELTVMADNLRALGLYLGSGFLVEGLCRHPLTRDGTVIDEYYMGKLRRASPAHRRSITARHRPRRGSSTTTTAGSPACCIATG